MNENILEKAREYEVRGASRISDEERPVFHITPFTGWMNDPNGFSLYKGDYHLFYQYHPYDTHWGPMHWGHVVSSDMIKWRYEKAALAPDMKYDNFGCFSGSAIELEDGRQALMYTGVETWKDENGEEQVRQTQCMAYGDGIDYKKYENNPVLTSKDTPEGASPVDFRDPKIFKDEDGFYYAVVGNRLADDSGGILLYRSADTYSWEFVTILDTCKNEYGKMWECPDFFPLEDKYLILTSPQEMLAKGREFHNGNGNIYLIGRYDKEKNCFERKQVKSIDFGLDFYAPQTLLTEDGRRVMIGWMQAWEASGNQPVGAKWFGMMTVPRQLSLKNGRLIQNPIKELENYRSNKESVSALIENERREFPNISGRVLDMTVDISFKDKLEEKQFRMYLAKDEDCFTELSFNPESGILKFDRTHSGFPYDVQSVREVEIGDKSDHLKLRIIMDRFSVEIFVNDGEQALSSTLYTRQSADAIEFEVTGLAKLDIEKYSIEV